MDKIYLLVKIIHFEDDPKENLKAFPSEKALNDYMKEKKLGGINDKGCHHDIEVIDFIDPMKLVANPLSVIYNNDGSVIIPEAPPIKN